MQGIGEPIPNGPGLARMSSTPHRDGDIKVPQSFRENKGFENMFAVRFAHKVFRVILPIDGDFAQAGLDPDTGGGRFTSTPGVGLSGAANFGGKDFGSLVVLDPLGPLGGFFFVLFLDDFADQIVFGNLLLVADFQEIRVGFDFFVRVGGIVIVPFGVIAKVPRKNGDWHISAQAKPCLRPGSAIGLFFFHALERFARISIIAIIIIIVSIESTIVVVVIITSVHEFGARHSGIAGIVIGTVVVGRSS